VGVVFFFFFFFFYFKDFCFYLKKKISNTNTG